MNSLFFKMPSSSSLARILSARRYSSFSAIDRLSKKEAFRDAYSVEERKKMLHRCLNDCCENFSSNPKHITNIHIMPMLSSEPGSKKFDLEVRKNKIVLPFYLYDEGSELSLFAQLLESAQYANTPYMNLHISKKYYGTLSSKEKSIID